MTAAERIALLKEMQNYCSVSGREGAISEYLAGRFDFKRDACGNLYALRHGYGKERRTILLEAHLDEVGFVVSELLPDGFLKLEPVGGIDGSPLPGTALEIFGKTRRMAVIGSKPPHLSKGDDKEKKDTVLYADAGFSDERSAKTSVLIGDPAHYAGPVKKMGKDGIVSRGLDNKGGVLCVIESFLSVTDPYHDLIFLLSVGEETSGSGVKAFTEKYHADVAIVVDAGFGFSAGLDRTHCIEMGMGPSVSFTDTLSLALSRWVADEANIAGLLCQIVAEPGGTGTNATALQIRHGGIPSVVISIPVLNMHTQSEVVYNKDLTNTTSLLIHLLTREDMPFGKETCYGGN